MNYFINVLITTTLIITTFYEISFVDMLKYKKYALLSMFLMVGVEKITVANFRFE